MDLSNTINRESETTGGQTMPLRDFGSFVNTSNVSDAEIKDHRSSDTVYVGLHMPRHNPHRRRHRGHKQKKRAQQINPDLAMTDATPPSQHVQFLLGEEEDDEEHRTHDLFCELGELFATPSGDLHWKETARWIKFEEDVEEGGERWSKPHVATLSLHSLFELRSCIHNGCVILDMDAQYFFQIIDLLLDQLTANNQLEDMLKDQVRDVLMQRHRHLNEKVERKHDNNSSRINLPLIRSLADIGRKYSQPREMSQHGNVFRRGQRSASMKGFKSSVKGDQESRKSLTAVKTMPNINLPKTESSAKMESMGSDSKLKRNQSSGNDLMEAASSVKLNSHFMKKIPPGSEAANVLVGEVDFLNHQIVAFIRLRQSLLLGDLTEVPVPTKFIFILLGPQGNHNRYHEIGRSIATLMTDEIFHDVAYHAHNREDLLAGIDEFLDQVTVLPPGEWDPTIRIEPPKSIPSQESRKTKDALPPVPNGKATTEEEDEGAPNADNPALQRTHRFFGGLIQDIKRKAPFYMSDFTDAFHVQSLASFMFLYFACLTPIITFGGLLADATEKDLGAFESLLAGCIVGVTYALCSGQPLTILGSTGPVLVFETILFDFCKEMGWYYLSFRWWVGMWTGFALITMVAFDLSALVRYITRFTEESFAALISIIFIKEAIAKCLAISHKAPVNLNPHISPFYDCACMSNVTDNNSTNTTTYEVISNKTIDWYTIHPHECENEGGVLVGSGCDHVADVFFLSVLLFIGTFTIAYSLKAVRNGKFFPTKVRIVISDFAVVIAIGSAVGIDAFLGLNTPKLEVPDKFHPTNYENRGWLIPPMHKQNPKWLCIAAIIPALLATILLFMDQQITAVIVNRKENKLKKGCGYHLDLLIVAILIIVNSILGLPYFVAATVLSITHVMSLQKESECTAPGERPKFLGVREQRVTAIAIFFMIGLSVFLTSLLKYIPMPVLYGVFLYMGISSLKGMQLVNRILIWFMPMKYQPDYTYLRHVRVRRVHIFTIIQVLCLVMLWVIKTIKSISILFPIMVLAMCFIRKGLDYVFSQTELKWLDDIMPEMNRREKDDKEREIKEQTTEECETLLDPKCAGSNPSNMPKASIVNLAINGGNDSFMDKMNITEEVSKCSIWKNMQSNESKGSFAGDLDTRDSSKRNLAKGIPVVLKVKRKHKKRHKKDPNGHHYHSGHKSHLPTIPSSPTLSGKKGNSVAFYINEEESDKEDHSDEDEHMGAPEIVVDPPSDSSRN